MLRAVVVLLSLAAVCATGCAAPNEAVEREQVAREFMQALYNERDIPKTLSLATKGTDCSLSCSRLTLDGLRWGGGNPTSCDRGPRRTECFRFKVKSPLRHHNSGITSFTSGHVNVYVRTKGEPKVVAWTYNGGVTVNRHD